MDADVEKTKLEEFLSTEKRANCFRRKKKKEKEKNRFRFFWRAGYQEEWPRALRKQVISITVTLLSKPCVLYSPAFDGWAKVFGAAKWRHLSMKCRVTLLKMKSQLNELLFCIFGISSRNEFCKENIILEFWVHRHLSFLLFLAKNEVRCSFYGIWAPPPPQPHFSLLHRAQEAR